MPEGRMISKSIAHSSQLAAVSLEADYLFARCIPHLDREGRMIGHPVLVKATACPLRPEITSDVIPELLRQLSAAGLVQCYEVDGKQVMQFPGFKRHQGGARFDREAASHYPAPPFDDGLDRLRINSGVGPEFVGQSEVNGSEVNVNGLLVVDSAREGNPQLDLGPATDPQLEPATDLQTQARTIIPAANGEPSTDLTVQAQALIRAANAGMAANPVLRESFRPIPANHGSLSNVVEWLQLGIPAAVISETVTARALTYRPQGSDKQIHSMLYFDTPVRNAFEKHLASTKGGKDGGVRGGKRTRPGGTASQAGGDEVAIVRGRYTRPRKGRT